jgi:hypothetical protein
VGEKGGLRMNFFRHDFFLYRVIISVLDCTLFAYFPRMERMAKRTSLPMDHNHSETFTMDPHARTQKNGTELHALHVLGMIALVASLTRACHSVPSPSALIFCLVWFMISTDDE